MPSKQNYSASTFENVVEFAYFSVVKMNNIRQHDNDAHKITNVHNDILLLAILKNFMKFAYFCIAKINAIRYS